MIYLILVIMALAMSATIKMHLYPKGDNGGIVQVFSNLYFKEKHILLIDIFLVLAYILFYKNYSFSIVFFSYVILTSILLTISIIDLKTKKIPNKLVVLGIILGLIIMFLNNKLSIISALLGLLVCGGIIALISIITKGAVGMGDAKLFACIGIFLGLQATLGIMLVSTILSGLVGLALLIFGMADRKTTLPFAPFISIAAIFMMLLN